MKPSYKQWKVLFVFKIKIEYNINTQKTLCSDNFMLKRLKAENWMCFLSSVYFKSWAWGWIWQSASRVKDN